MLSSHWMLRSRSKQSPATNECSASSGMRYAIGIAAIAMVTFPVGIAADNCVVCN